MDLQWRRQQAAQAQANADRGYQFDVSQAKDANWRDYRNRTATMLDRGADMVADDTYRRNTFGETVRHNKAMEGVGMTRESRLGQPKSGTARTPFSAFFQQGGGSTRGKLAHMRGSLATGPAGATMQAVQAAGVQPLARFSDPRMSAVNDLNQTPPIPADWRGTEQEWLEYLSWKAGQ
jgi:hypothetical protein